jgi:predicted MFS family arabinose efflux permease
VSNAYAKVLRLPGAWQFVAAAAVARLPLSMDGLAVVLLISTLSDSYARAGIVVAAFGVTGAVGSVLIARAADRFGQARLLIPSSAVHALALVTLVVIVELDLPLALQILTAGIAGISGPPIGSFARARWVKVSPDDSALRSGFAVESILDEVIFTVGPLLTAWLAFTYALPLPIFVAAALVVSGSIVLSLQRTTQPDVVAVAHRVAHRSALRSPGLVIVVMSALGLGCLFGSFEVTTVAFTRLAGHSGSAGLVLGIFALASLIGGVAYGSRHWSGSLPRQAAILLTIFALACAALPWVRSIPALTVATVVAGLLVAPALITIFALTERLVPAQQITEGLSWSLSGLALGFAFGSWLGGTVVDSVGTSAAYGVAAIATAWSLVWILAGTPAMTTALADRPASGRVPPAIPALSDPVPGPAPAPFDEGP